MGEKDCSPSTKIKGIPKYLISPLTTITTGRAAATPISLMWNAYGGHLSPRCHCCDGDMWTEATMGQW